MNWIQGGVGPWGFIYSREVLHQADGGLSWHQQRCLRLRRQSTEFLHKPMQAIKMLLWMAASVQEAVDGRF